MVICIYISDISAPVQQFISLNWDFDSCELSKILKSAVLCKENASQTSLWLPVWTFFFLKSMKCQHYEPFILLSFQQKRMLIPVLHCVVWVNHSNRKVDHLQRLTMRERYWPPISRPDISFTLSCNAGSHCAMWEGPATFTPSHSPLKNEIPVTAFASQQQQ